MNTLSFCLENYPTPQQCRILAASATTAHGNAGYLTQWARPGIEPAFSWILVGFIITEPQQELPCLHFWRTILLDKLFFFFFFSFGCGMCKFPSQGANPCYISNTSCYSDNAGSHCTTRKLPRLKYSWLAVFLSALWIYHPTHSRPARFLLKNPLITLLGFPCMRENFFSCFLNSLSLIFASFIILCLGKDYFR